MKRMGCAVLAIVLLFCLVPVEGQAAGLEIEGKSALLMEVSTGRVLFELRNWRGDTEKCSLKHFEK